MKILVIAGPNGAGKTTFAQEFLPREADCPLFVNADLIAAGLSPFRPEAAAIRAGRLMLEEIDRNAAEGVNFAFETTLAGHTYRRRIAAWRAAGYYVKLIFLSLATPEDAIARVALRVRQGGHDIPAEVVTRRFHAGARNFEICREEVDYWQLFENSGPVPLSLETNLPDTDLQAAPRALLRAAQRAREVARRLGTGIVIRRDGVLVEESPDAETPTSRKSSPAR